MTKHPSTTSDAKAHAPDEPAVPPTHTCPACHAVYSEQVIANANYRCSKCGLEMAFIETAVNGGPAKVLTWLHQPKDILLGRYRIDGILAQGGFAATYLVSDLHVNDRKRALKEIPKARFNPAEEVILSQLNHPAIPDIVDRGESRDSVYLVLKFGGGQTLENERRHRGGRIPLDILLPWIIQLGDVVDYLHSRKPPIIHRDLKPDNVLLDDHDHIMLIDFGIAKRSSGTGHTSAIARATTHGYSPPEQALGTGTDLRSDVYSLAATMYALLTGRVPPPAHVRVAGGDLPPPAELVPGLPNPINAALIDALNLNINLRPQSISAFMERITAAGTQVSTGSQSVAPTLMLKNSLSGHGEQPARVRIGNEQAVLTSPITLKKHAKRGHRMLAPVILIVVVAGSALLAIREDTANSPMPPPSDLDNSAANIGIANENDTNPPSLADNDKSSSLKHSGTDPKPSIPKTTTEANRGERPIAEDPSNLYGFHRDHPTPTYRLGTGHPTSPTKTYLPQGHLIHPDRSPTIFSNGMTDPAGNNKGPDRGTKDKTSLVKATDAPHDTPAAPLSTISKQLMELRATPTYRMGTGHPTRTTRPYLPQGHLAPPQ